MLFPQLEIAHMRPRLPIIQGGMALRVATAKLAAAVANAGGIGIIAGTGLSPAQLVAEIRRARELTGGYIGVNVLFAVRQFADLIKTAMQEKVDFVISGAGFSRDIYEWGREHNVPVISIVSSARLAKLAEKLGAAAVVTEGKEAGGHLGTDRPAMEILPEVAESVKIPVIAAGGIVDGYDIARALQLGANGVQMASRFVASEECEAHENFKKMYLKGTHEDSVLIDSPVGLPGRALRNAFTEAIAGDKKLPITRCRDCLKHCSRRFCIFEALERAVEGDVERGLVFAGEFVHKIKEILPVQKIMERLSQEYAQAMGLAPALAVVGK